MLRGCRCTIWLATLILASCGGGGGSADSDSSSAGGTLVGSLYAAGGANVVAISIGPGPNGVSTFNIPYTSVTVCAIGTSSCATIDHVLVDTGSTGLRLMASVLAGLALTHQVNPNNNADVIAECLPFADGYAWGAVANVAVSIGGESASSVPIQVIDDNGSFAPPVPASCSAYGASLNSVTAFGANGVLGIGLFSQDCGAYCAQSNGNYDWYYSCTSTQCASTIEPLESQVANPVVLLANDNNGVIIQLPTITAGGATAASGYLVFGIGTQSNNSLGSATVLTVDPQTGDFATTYAGHTLNGGFIDSGSNGLFFTDPMITDCSGSVGAQFYCPASTLDLTASNQGQNGNTSTVAFQIANLSARDTANFALNDVGGAASTIAWLGTDYFDWGLPFFYGRTVYTAIEGQVAGSATGPYFAY
ncbi:MAG: DUF3443 domain-containing protein [Steroidobacteraceae bacterium]